MRTRLNVLNPRGARARATHVVVLAASIGVLCSADFAHAGTARPRNVAVVPEGFTMLVAGAGSPRVTQMHFVPGMGMFENGAFDLGFNAWDIEVLGSGNHAVISHPLADKISVMDRNPGATTWRFINYSLDAPYYCTEIIPDPGNPFGFFVASRGSAPAGAEEWQHAVYQFDASLPQSNAITKTFVTEREPRALAVSPDGTVLFVGHVQGALQGTTVGTNVPFPASQHPANLFDGGSIVAFDINTAQPLFRVAVGSPVRGLAVLPVASGTIAYRLYFTHVGDGAQSEAPTLGGRNIPNVISSIALDASNAVVTQDAGGNSERHDVILAHDPDAEFDAGYNPGDHTAQPAIVPEQLVFRQDPATSSWELWVTNSASGTVSRVPIDAEGRIEVDRDGGGAPIPTSIIAGAEQLPVVNGRGADIFIDDPQDITRLTAGTADNSVATVWYEQAINVHHVVVDRATPSPPSPLFSSHPRGIAYDATYDVLYVVTEFDAELVQISGSTGAISDRHDVCWTNCTVPADERDFFTFGRGFDFREPSSALVNTISCSTCHVEGHVDGKVRFTGSVPGGKPVSVPSVFDVGATEWIFFNGRTTILDGDDSQVPCNYCETAGFFPDTQGFTDEVTSPMSPSAPDNGLSLDQIRGRSLFERMNCVRCHNGTVDTFLRTDFLASELPGPGPQGPISTHPPAITRRLLHDASQVFVTEETVNLISERNKSSVGTQKAGDAPTLVQMGINTPALAGAWDNRPYMHDGRYRTLQEVLEHTRLDPNDEHFAAPLWELGGVPDNAFNQFVDNGVSPVPGPDADDFDMKLAQFKTHIDSDAGAAGRVKVVDFLNNSEDPGALDDLVAFLSATSSETDLCDTTPALTISNISVTGSYPNYTASWTTPYPISCEVRWHRFNETVPDDPLGRTKVGTSHSVPIQVSQTGQHTVIVDASSQLCVDSATNSTSWNATNGGGPPCRKCPPPQQPKAGPAETRIVGSHMSADDDGLQVHFELATRGAPEMRVYSVAGRLVRQHRFATVEAGHWTWLWDGTDHSNTPVASGIYYVQMRHRDKSDRSKVVLLK